MVTRKGPEKALNSPPRIEDSFDRRSAPTGTALEGDLATESSLIADS
jgi:hypothetical protein